MSTEQQKNEFQEILNILDPDIGHFPDKLAKWILRMGFLSKILFYQNEGTMHDSN